MTCIWYAHYTYCSTSALTPVKFCDFHNLCKIKKLKMWEKYCWVIKFSDRIVSQLLNWAELTTAICKICIFNGVTCIWWGLFTLIQYFPSSVHCFSPKPANDRRISAWLGLRRDRNLNCNYSKLCRAHLTSLVTYISRLTYITVICLFDILQISGGILI